MRLLEGEPAVGPWRAMDLVEVVEAVLREAGDPAGRPRIVVVDGRGASGKTTLADRVAAQVPGSAVVHADDLAWHEPFFGWGHLLRDGVLTPLHRGEGVRLRPPAWERLGRDGVVEVPADSPLVVIEGTGAAQRELDPLVDATLWVQSDFAEAERRGIARDIAQGVNGDPEETVAFWHEWMAHEVAFLAAHRPWERAVLVVAGTATIPLATGQVAVADPPGRTRASRRATP